MSAFSCCGFASRDDTDILAAPSIDYHEDSFERIRANSDKSFFVWIAIFYSEGIIICEDCNSIGECYSMFVAIDALFVFIPLVIRHSYYMHKRTLAQVVLDYSNPK